MFNIHLYHINFNKTNIQKINITILHGKKNISINNNTLITLQKFFKKNYTSHTNMSQTKNNINTITMKITTNIIQHTN